MDVVTASKFNLLWNDPLVEHVKEHMGLTQTCHVDGCNKYWPFQIIVFIYSFIILNQNITSDHFSKVNCCVESETVTTSFVFCFMKGHQYTTHSKQSSSYMNA